MIEDKIFTIFNFLKKELNGFSLDLNKDGSISIKKVLKPEEKLKTDRSSAKFVAEENDSNSFLNKKNDSGVKTLADLKKDLQLVEIDRMVKSGLLASSEVDMLVNLGIPQDVVYEWKLNYLKSNPPQDIKDLKVIEDTKFSKVEDLSSDSFNEYLDDLNDKVEDIKQYELVKEGDVPKERYKVKRSAPNWGEKALLEAVKQFDSNTESNTEKDYDKIKYKVKRSYPLTDAAFIAAFSGEKELAKCLTEKHPRKVSRTIDSKFDKKIAKKDLLAEIQRSLKEEYLSAYLKYLAFTKLVASVDKDSLDLRDLESLEASMVTVDDLNKLFDKLF